MVLAGQHMMEVDEKWRIKWAVQEQEAKKAKEAEAARALEAAKRAQEEEEAAVSVHKSASSRASRHRERSEPSVHSRRSLGSLSATSLVSAGAHVVDDMPASMGLSADDSQKTLKKRPNAQQVTLSSINPRLSPKRSERLQALHATATGKLWTSS
eukprot:TRINITY_DN85361_c0_g1_i1.p1 TRINITY_DN85361_c0_g1~~TRINITY_DN85361_c0_g1_i1.p1  ORF type:complete len:155 (+),score=40.96 TRINITY_DN85361_c0_g1_i1:79-543(+)